MTIKLHKLNNTIIKCKKCPRLTKFIKKISTEKRKKNIQKKNLKDHKNVLQKKIKIIAKK